MSDRIKAALAVAKARGVKLGGNKGTTPERIRAAQKAAAIARTAYALARARDLAPLVWQLRGEGKSCRQIATELERLGINPSRGGKWHDSAVRKIFLRTAQEFSPDGASYTMLDVRRKQYEDRVRSFAPLILELRSKGMSFHQIAEEFNRRQFISRRDGKWNSSTIFRYTGAMVDHIGAKLNCCSSNDTKFPGASS
jgi:Recombinase